MPSCCPVVAHVVETGRHATVKYISGRRVAVNRNHLRVLEPHVFQVDAIGLPWRSLVRRLLVWMLVSIVEHCR